MLLDKQLIVSIAAHRTPPELRPPNFPLSLANYAAKLDNTGFASSYSYIELLHRKMHPCVNVCGNAFESIGIKLERGRPKS